MHDRQKKLNPIIIFKKKNAKNQVPCLNTWKSLDGSSYGFIMYGVCDLVSCKNSVANWYETCLSHIYLENKDMPGKQKQLHHCYSWRLNIIGTTTGHVLTSLSRTMFMCCGTSRCLLLKRHSQRMSILVLLNWCTVILWSKHGMM
jgi:hypothetical protein